MNKKTSNSLGKGFAEIQQEIKDSGGNISKVARAFGFEYYALKEMFSETEKTFHSARGPEPNNIKSLGKPGMERYVVAVKKVGYNWPDKYKGVIKLARQSYDRGTHEMVTGHHNGWVVLYCIPRLVRAKPRPYFSTMEVFQ